MNATYAGNRMQHFLLPDPHIVGPDNASGYAVAVSAGWDETRDRTTVSFRPLLPNEITLAYRDDAGNRRLRNCGTCLVEDGNRELGLETAERCVRHHPPASVAAAAQIALWLLQGG